MSTFLQEELGVAMSGTKWEVANYTLWQSTRPDIVLFAPKQPRLAKSSTNGRYQMGMSVHRAQKADGSVGIKGGSAIFTITSAIQHDPRAFEELTNQWKQEMAAMGPAAPQGVRFIPLSTQKGEAVVLIDPSSGTPDPEHNNKDVGTPGGYSSFLVRLTEQGAQEWAHGIRNKKAIPAGVKYSYEYLRMLPDIGATVEVIGSRVFTHLSMALKVSVKYGWFGGSAEINAAWEKMTRNGDVKITFIGAGLPPELEALRSEMVTTFSNQARDQLFKALFEPAPQIQDAQAGNTSGAILGANYAMKWKKQSEATNLNLELRFKGWTWLRTSMDADVTALFHELDESYVNEVPIQVSFPAAVQMDSDPVVASSVMSWSASEGAIPQAPVFGPEGGNQTYTVTSQKPDDVVIRYKAKVNFVPPRWPPIESSGEAKVSAGGNAVVVKPSSWVGRHWIFMFVRDGNRILGPSELDPDDNLVCNVSYSGSHLSSAGGTVKDSAKITPLEPLEFSYPLSPKGERGIAKFSAFGVVNGQLLRAKEQTITFQEDAVFILADPKNPDPNKRIQLVSQATAIGESDRLASDLLRAGARPIVKPGDTVPPEVREEIMRRPRQEAQPGEETAKTGDGNGQDTSLGDGYDTAQSISGLLKAVEYAADYGAIIVDTTSGPKRIRVRNKDDLDHLDDKPRQVKVVMDPDGRYAERIALIL